MTDTSSSDLSEVISETLSLRGLDPALAQFVTATSAEEISEQIEQLERFAKPAPAAPKATRTPGDPAGGLTPYDEPDRFDKDSFLDSYNRSRGWTY